MPNNDMSVLSPSWKNFIESKQINSADVPNFVSNSWKRSADFGVDPYTIEDDLLSQQSLREKIKENRQLIEVADPVMETLYGMVKGSGFTVFLTDNNGVILKGTGDPDFLTKTQKIMLTVGANWNEATRGTNAIGTAIVDEKPMTINGWQHFCKENHFITCSAAPIKSPTGEVLGVLDVTGDYRYAHPHTLAMVAYAASLVENRLQLQDSNQQITLMRMHADTISESANEGYMCIDRKGYISFMSCTCAKILGVTKGLCIGQSLSDVLGERQSPWMEVMDRHTRLENLLKQASLKMGFTFSVNSVKDVQGRWLGSVASVKRVISSGNLISGIKESIRYSFDNIIGKSPRITEAKNLAQAATNVDLTVLLQGETGTGKEIFAQSIHKASARGDKPFIAVNCGALPKSLIESELLGYEAGAFTGAKRTGHPGKFELADGGTIFLDEIGDMPLEVQTSLLRVLEERQLVRVGGTKVIPINVRVIAATNKDLEKETNLGNFRRDLYYRLNIFSINIPNLHDREQDIFLIAEHYLTSLGANFNKPNLKLSPEVKNLFLHYSWPGNVRELKNIIERAIAITQDDFIKVGDLPEYLRNTAPSIVKPPELIPSAPDSTTNEYNLKNVEKMIIQEALTQYEGNISKVAAALGIGRNTLYKKMEEYHLKNN